MKITTIIFLFLLAGCANSSFLDYPGGPKDIARYNQIHQAKMEDLKRQNDEYDQLNQARMEEIKRQSEIRERQAAEDSRARVALAEEQRRLGDEEGQKTLEAFVKETSAEMALVEENKSVALEQGRKYSKDIEAYIKRQLNQTQLKVRCRFEGNGTDTDEVQCAVITSNADRRALHDLQNITYALAVDLKRVYPTNYSIFAQTSDDVPLARFMYNYPFDLLTPLIMWQ